MSYFDDQEEAWFANDCKGRIEDYDPFDPGNFVEDRPRQQRVSEGRSRALLALSKIDEFAAWAITQGYTRETPKGTYEVLRLRIKGQAPLLYFKKAESASGGDPQHATSYGEGTGLVKRWINNRKQQNVKVQA